MFQLNAFSLLVNEFYLLHWMAKFNLIEKLFRIGFKMLTCYYVQRSVSIKVQYTTLKLFFFCKAHVNITAVNCCTFYNSSPIELKQQDRGVFVLENDS